MKPEKLLGVTPASLFHNCSAYPTKATAVLTPTLQFQLVCAHTSSQACLSYSKSSPCPCSNPQNSMMPGAHCSTKARVSLQPEMRHHPQTPSQDWGSTTEDREKRGGAREKRHVNCYLLNVTSCYTRDLTAVVVSCPRSGQLKIPARMGQGYQASSPSRVAIGS